SAMNESAISLRSASFSWPSGERALSDVSMDLPQGCRSIVVGANGAGKTCLLRIVGGMYHYEGSVKVFGKEAYVPNRLGNSGSVEIICGTNIWRQGECTIVGERWQPRGDCSVRSMLDLLSDWDRDRMQMIVDKFHIDLNWRVNQLSDGKKRRVQLLLAFLKPSAILLLDEVTTDLDVLARQSLLQFLQEENEKRSVTILFSTHIFDGLEEWGTHVTYIKHGTLCFNKPMDQIEELAVLRQQEYLTPLFEFVCRRVHEDAAEYRRKRAEPREQCLTGPVEVN
ncbi:hypothetical protein GUITHDRAFT_65510, partial [Guillardia theta CCMP2712]